MPSSATTSIHPLSVWHKHSRLAWQLLLGALHTPFYGSPHAPRGKQRISLWHRQVCRALGVEVAVHGTPQPGVLYVCNHISWLDIPVLGGQLAGVRFLSKREVRAWPLIGWLAHRAGTLFVERGKSEGSIELITEALRAGHSVLIFPEGTTTNGLDVRRFHPRLLQAAFEAQACIQPIALRYLNAAGTPEPAVAYIDEDSFTDTLRRIVAVRGLRAELHFLPPLEPHTLPRRALAERAHAVIRQALPHVSDHPTD